MNSPAPLPVHRVDHTPSHALADCAQRRRAHSRLPSRNASFTADGFAPVTRQRIRTRYRWIGLVVTFGLVSGCATQLQVGSDYDRSATFRDYHTFAVMQRESPGLESPLNPLVAARVEDAIRMDLRERGYVEARDPQVADFVVDFTIGTRERTDITTNPQPYAGWGWGGPGWWGGPYWGDPVDVHQYREGTLSVDVFDAHSHRPVWHGWAKKELSDDDIEHSTEPVQRAVAAVLAKFPPA
jgi:hypothetical protein